MKGHKKLHHKTRTPTKYKSPWEQQQWTTTNSPPLNRHQSQPSVAPIHTGGPNTYLISQTLPRLSVAKTHKLSSQCSGLGKFRTFSKYCKSWNFRENFIFANNIKRHIYEAKNSQLGHDIHISVNNRVISAFGKDFIFMKLPICEVSRKNKTLAKISEFTVSLQRNNQNKLTKCDESILYFYCSLYVQLQTVPQHKCKLR